MRPLAFWCGLLLLFALPLAAQAGSYQIGGYDFWLLPAQQNKELRIDGRIEGGAPCKGLHLEVKLIGDKGGKASVRAIIRDAGGFGSRLIEGKNQTKAPAQSWQIDEVKLRCKER